MQYSVSPGSGFRRIALQELDVGQAVDDAAARVRVEVLEVVREQFRRHEIAQLADVLGAVRRLHFAEQALEGLEVGRRGADLIGVRWPRIGGAIAARGHAEAAAEATTGSAKIVRRPRVRRVAH